MRRIEKMLFSGTGYTVLFNISFYLFALAVNLESKAISYDKFFLILAFGMITSITDLICDLVNIKKWLKRIMHFGILLTAFCIVFISGEFFTTKGPASVFVAISIFVLIYLVFAGVIALIKKSLNLADNALDGHTENKRSNVRNENEKENKYTPRFK